jgi:hypothetical protein
MKEFVLVFRTFDNPEFTASPEQMQEMLTNWMNWMGGIAAQDKLVNRGSRLSISNAKTVKPNNVVVDGPYTEIKEFINGYTVIKAGDINEAVEMASGCPILQTGGNVEVRAVVASDDNS